jgi:hypothetical protein
MGWLAFVTSMVCLAACKESPTSLEGVSADSRCAQDVTCVWEGDAAVTVSAQRTGGDLARFELHTSGSMGPREARHGDFLITMVDLRPQPRSTRPIDSSDYRLDRLVLRVTR